MSDAEATPEIHEVTTRFITYHLSAADVHLRTDAGVMWIPKGQDELQAFAKGLKRGQPIKASGEYVLSKTLSSTVLQLQSLERA